MTQSSLGLRRLTQTRLCGLLAFATVKHSPSPGSRHYRCQLKEVRRIAFLFLLSNLLSIFNIYFPEANRKVTYDLSDSLGELRDQFQLSRADFRLSCDGFILRDDHRSLLQLGIDASSRLVAVPKTRAVMVRQWGAEPVPLGELRTSISWRDLRQKVSAALNIEVAPGTRLVCECGRTSSEESAARRKLPRRCCDTEELVLTVCEPPRGESEMSAWAASLQDCVRCWWICYSLRLVIMLLPSKAQAVSRFPGRAITPSAKSEYRCTVLILTNTESDRRSLARA